MNYTPQFERTETTLRDEIQPPSDLVEQIPDLRAIQRYQYEVYPPGIFEDNVEFHLLRMVAFTRSLSLDPDTSEKLERYIWVHDIPEIIIGDTTIVAKDFDLGQQDMLALKRDEDAAARALLNPSDYQLWVQFEKASAFLKGEDIPLEEIDPIALLSKVIDRIDGDVYFHYALAEYMKREGLVGTPLPPENAMGRFFTRYRDFQDRIESYTGDYDILLLALVFLAFDEVESIWAQVDPGDIPEVIQRNRI